MLEKILVVDDDVLKRLVLSRTIGSAGYKVVFGSSGEECLILAAKEKPDLVLLDVRLPGIDGIETLKLLRADSATKDLYVVLISAMEYTPEEQAIGLEAGAFDFICKQIQPNDLLARIRVFLQHKKTIDELRETSRLFENIINASPNGVKISRLPDGTIINVIEDSSFYMNDEQHKAILQTAMDGFWITDTRGYLIEVNDAYCQMSGYSPEELKGKHISELDDTETADDTAIRIQHIVKQGESRFETRHRRKDGSIYPVEACVQFKDINGGWFFGFVRDITERKHAEKELCRLSKAVQQSPISVMITDTSGNIEYVNRKTLEITGYSLEDLLGQSVELLFSAGDNTEEEKKTMWETISSGKEWSGEFHNKKKNGELYWESSSICPIVDDKGNIIHYLAIKEEVTEKKQLINELLEAKEKAEVANKLKDAFIANISHEIRTPLNGILGMTEIIHDKFIQFAEKEDDRFFTSLEKSTGRLIKTVDQILNFSRLQVEEYPSNKVSISLKDVLQTLIAKYIPRAAKQFIKINFTCATDDVNIFADHSALYLALENLIDNAVKFTEEGSIDISLYSDQQKNLYIKISDTGIGISEEYLVRLFDPYSQEVSGFSRPYEGLGLGLPITRKLLELNGASISVTSQKGKGTVFTICFENPVNALQSKKPDLDERVKVQPPKTISGKKPVVLLVEDDRVNQLVVETILKNKFDLEIAPDALAASKLFQSMSFDLILMDISLQKAMNGLELTKNIREGNINPNIPIIALTGHALPGDHKRSIEAGCNEYLAKPYKRAELLEKIRMFIN